MIESLKWDNSGEDQAQAKTFSIFLLSCSWLHLVLNLCIATGSLLIKGILVNTLFQDSLNPKQNYRILPCREYTI